MRRLDFRPPFFVAMPSFNDPVESFGYRNYERGINTLRYGM
jgi:hypothetical protein